MPIKAVFDSLDRWADKVLACDEQLVRLLVDTAMELDVSLPASVTIRSNLESQT